MNICLERMAEIHPPSKDNGLSNNETEENPILRINSGCSSTIWLSL